MSPLGEVRNWLRWFYLSSWKYRAVMVGYLARRPFRRPAPDAARCYMGAPVDPSLHCPRWVARGDVWWCEKHKDAARRSRYEGDTR